jgi:hypothetical protein
LDGGSGATVFFDLTGVPQAVVSGTNDCSSGNVGSICAPPGSPFTFYQISANQVQIGFVVDAIAYTNNSSSGSTAYVANFSTTLSGMLTGFGCTSNCTDTIPNILNFEGLGFSIESSWSATESPIPEPMTAVLFGAGLIGLSMIGRRRRRA